MTRVKYFNNIDQAKSIPPTVSEEARPVTERYRFRANDYYLSLIDWTNPNDPIRRIVIPHESEIDSWGQLDPSNEQTNYVAPGTQHKYTDTVLMLISETCGAFCRYCFRKRIFIDDSEVTGENLSAGIEYVKQNKQIKHVLLSGGDPMMLSTKRLEAVVSKLSEIDHLSTIRVGTKMLAFNPYRILDHPDLPAMLGSYSSPEKRIWVMAHFNCVEEITPLAVKAVDMLLNHGLVMAHQTPLLTGVNDSPSALVKLFNRLVSIGISPYYLFQCRPTAGNHSFAVPLTRGYRILRKAGRQISGLAKRARFVMSHATGKIEMVGLDEKHIYMKYHRARNEAEDGRFMIFHRDDRACWPDDLRPVNKGLNLGKQSGNYKYSDLPSEPDGPVN